MARVGRQSIIVDAGGEWIAREKGSMRYVYVCLLGGRDIEVLCRFADFEDIVRDETARARRGRGSGRAYTNDFLRPSPGGAEVEK